MSIQLMKRFKLLTLFVVLSLYANSQQNALIIESPEVHPDNKVTFRLLAPHAKEVKLSAQFQKGPVDMTMDERGVWSITVDPVKRDLPVQNSCNEIKCCTFCFHGFVFPCNL
jgi:1,4-alpha-glucan branching enzyme